MSSQEEGGNEPDREEASKEEECGPVSDKPFEVGS